MSIFSWSNQCQHKWKKRWSFKTTKRRLRVQLFGEILHKLSSTDVITKSSHPSMHSKMHIEFTGHFIVENKDTNTQVVRDKASIRTRPPAPP
jgi:hypothetical protein